jgi:hypothetical protein
MRCTRIAGAAYGPGVFFRLRQKQSGLRQKKSVRAGNKLGAPETSWVLSGMLVGLFSAGRRGSVGFQMGIESTWIARREFLKAGAALGIASRAGAQAAPAANGADDRAYWLHLLDKICAPVMRALSQGKLKATMPVAVPMGNLAERKPYAYLAALANVLAGIAPWLETGGSDGSEGALRQQYAGWARAAVQSACDPQSPDFVDFNEGSQPVVDAAFLALAIVRAPNELWHKLDPATQQKLMKALQSTRVIRPGYNNWLLFSAMVEAGLAFMGQTWDPMRVDLALRSVELWYKGDGAYGDGPEFHWDYYNSFVLHPMMVNVLEVIRPFSKVWEPLRPDVLARARRYAAIQERMISPEATYPPIGRSLSDRTGAFHLLAQMALRRELPETVSPAQVRCALTAVMRRMLEAPGTFDAQGWLQVGFCGAQPSIAETYISTGTAYICTWAMLPLGLPPDDPFWAAPPEPWTSKKAWSGVDIPNDHAIRD